MDISMIVPTSTGAANIPELVTRIGAAVTRFETEIVCVGDSTDDTPRAIARAIAQVDSRTDVYPLHRKKPARELSGAVVTGIRKGTADGAIVMDRDLQYPPKMMPVLVTAGKATGADVVIGSRHAQAGSSAGLDGSARAIASLGAEVLAWAMFPLKLSSYSDPMTGFFAARRASFLAALRFGCLSGFPVIGGLLSPADRGRPTAQL